MGIFTTVIATPALSSISSQVNVLPYNTASQTANKKTTNQQQSLTDKVKKFLFFINPWQTSRLDQLGRVVDTKETSKNNPVHPTTTFWNTLRTFITNTYNDLGRTIGFFTAENKQKKEEETNKYNEKGEINSYNESSYGETTISPTNGANYNTVGQTIQNIETDIKPKPTATPTSMQGQRSKLIPTSTPTSQPTVARTQFATPSPTTSSRQRR